MARATRFVLSVLAVLAIVVALLRPHGAAPPPLGASHLPLATGSPTLLPPILSACPTALLADVRLVRQGGGSHGIAFVTVDGGAEARVTWPYGFSARVFRGRPELVAPDGSVLAAEGDVLTGFGGGVGIDDSFHVCGFGMVKHAGG